jgi:sulfite exporter TauE/SafE
MAADLLIAFTLGLFSSVHCLGMCGGIITALSLGLPEGLAGSRRRRAACVSCYNLGRILSYSLAGALAGGFGLALNHIINTTTGYNILRWCAGLMLVLLGLHLAGWLPALRKLEGAGLRLWQVLRPVGALFLPVDTLYKALLMGCIWGWLPCGLVYSVLLWSAASGDPVTATLVMFCFGLGTLPSMITAGLLGDALQQLARRANVRKVFGSVVIVFGLLSPWLQPVQHPHSPAPTEQHRHG